MISVTRFVSLFRDVSAYEVPYSDAVKQTIFVIKIGIFLIV